MSTPTPRPILDNLRDRQHRCSVYAVQSQLDGFRIPAAGVDKVLACIREPDGGPFDYGALLALAWAERPSPNEPGMLVVEGDCLVDPHDMAIMERAIADGPEDVVTAPVVCWPATTGRHDPLTLPRYNHGFMAFGLGCTWLPARLLSDMATELPATHWMALDGDLSKRAKTLGLTVRTPHGTTVKHAHY